MFATIVSDDVSTETDGWFHLPAQTVTETTCDPQLYVRTLEYVEYLHLFTLFVLSETSMIIHMSF